MRFFLYLSSLPKSQAIGCNEEHPARAKRRCGANFRHIFLASIYFVPVLVHRQAINSIYCC